MGLCLSSDYVLQLVKQSAIRGVVTHDNLADLSRLLVSHRVPYQYQIDSSSNAMFIITEGYVKICLIRPKGQEDERTEPAIRIGGPQLDIGIPSVKSANLRLSQKVPVEYLENKGVILSAGQLFCFFDGDSSPNSLFKISCVASSPECKTTVAGLSKNNISLMESNTNFSGLHKLAMTRPDQMIRAPVFKGFTTTLMSIVLPMLRLSHVGEGYAVVLKGKACVERRRGIIILLSGEMVQTADSNFMYPLSQSALHDEDKDIVTAFSSKSLSSRRRSKIHPDGEMSTALEHYAGSRKIISERTAKSVRVVSRKVVQQEMTDLLASSNMGSTSLIAIGDAIVGCCSFFPGFRSGVSVVARTDCVIGHLTLETLAIINALDDGIEQKLKRNIIFEIIQKTKNRSGFLRLLSAELLLKIAAKSEIVVLSQGENAFSAGSEVEVLSILLDGHLRISKSNFEQKSNDHAQYAASPDTTSEDNDKFQYPFTKGKPLAGKALDKGSTVFAGNVAFGEVCLIAPVPSRYYGYSDSSAESVVLLNIPSHVFDEYVFQPELELDAQEQINAAGNDVDLVHVLRSSVGYKMFSEYLRNEMAVEGTHFWKGVDRYSSLLNKIDLKDSATSVGDFDDFLFSKCIELQSVCDVAFSLITHYINEGSSYQVNIPHTLRKQINKLFEEAVVACDSIMSAAQMMGPLSSASEIDVFFSKYSNTIQLFGNLFSKAKQEVYLLLREDSFKRWRKTTGFSAFINVATRLKKH